MCANPIEGRRKAGTVGLPFPDTLCRIVDPDDWTRELPTGEEGELVVAGPQVMKGYWGREQETAEVLRVDPDGVRWLLTGDIARMDEDGYITIVDRKKDMIVVSGFNVYPSEVEQVLYRHPRTGMAGYRVPREVEIRASLPETLTGKVLRRVLLKEERETAAAGPAGRRRRATPRLAAWSSSATSASIPWASTSMSAVLSRSPVMPKVTRPQ